ncbi:MAG: YlbF family regulator [Bacilli bacterium]|jgi:cell fate (sporulation/competence/biofilm development) regulator YmcA (YheA/YmcA/DUF963 family)
MSDLETQIKQLKEALDSLPEVVAFNQARQAVLANPELNALDEKKRHAQRAMAESMGEEALYHQHKADYEAYEAAYENHPLVANYRELREAVYYLLVQIKDLLSLE